ncbi:MAG: hypothetical protein KDH09_09080 [Chrysiogenetes bacterium]|nr:hypothetical protein [Chrysiogenetes bacterium]
MDPVHNRELHLLVRQHKVVYEVRPNLNYTQGNAREIGFDVTLYGTHVQPAHPPDPGCHECAQVWRDLSKIARAAIPPDDHESRSAIAPFDQLLHESAARNFRYDVELTIEVRHRKHFLDPADASESHTVKAIVNALKELGAQEHTWSEIRAKQHMIPKA